MLKRKFFTHFMALVSFSTSRKHLKSRSFLLSSGCIGVTDTIWVRKQSFISALGSNYRNNPRRIFLVLLNKVAGFRDATQLKRILLQKFSNNFCHVFEAAAFQNIPGRDCSCLLILLKEIYL